MTPSTRIAASLTICSRLLLLPAVGGGCKTWRSASRESLLEVAGQPDVEDRTLTLPRAPTRLALEGNAGFKLHTSAGLVGPFASRELHFEDGVVQISARGSAPIQIGPGQILWAELAVADPESDLVAGAFPDGISSQVWRSVSPESVLDVARQTNVEHRVLETPTKPETIDIDGDTAVRIHTVDGVWRPLPSRYLHASAYGVELDSPAAPPITLDPVGADFRVADPHATTALVLGLAIPGGLLVLVAVVAAVVVVGKLNQPWGPIYSGPGGF